MTQFKALKEFLDKETVTKFVYLSDNQDTFDITSSCVFQLYFTEVVINESINRICFKGNGGSMRIGSVKDVQISDGAIKGDKLIKVISESKCTLFKRWTYTFVAHLNTR